MAQIWGAPSRLVGSDRDYWVRTWAARTLLYAWDAACLPDIVAGLSDPAWRVREMCAKVAVRWEIGEAADDDEPAVRTAAVRAGDRLRERLDAAYP